MKIQTKEDKQEPFNHIEGISYPNPKYKEDKRWKYLFYHIGNEVIDGWLDVANKRMIEIKKESLEDELEFLESILNNQSILMKENINRLCLPKRNKGSFTSVTLDSYIERRITEIKQKLENLK